MESSHLSMEITRLMVSAIYLHLIPVGLGKKHATFHNCEVSCSFGTKLPGHINLLHKSKLVSIQKVTNRNVFEFLACA